LRQKNSTQTSFFQPQNCLRPFLPFFVTFVYQNSKMFDKLCAKKINSNLFQLTTKPPAPMVNVFQTYVYQILKMYDELQAKKFKSNLFLSATKPPAPISDFF
jgi:hypothetical protein